PFSKTRGSDFCEGNFAHWRKLVCWVVEADNVLPIGSALPEIQSSLASSLAIQNVYAPVSGGTIQPRTHWPKLFSSGFERGTSKTSNVSSTVGAGLPLETYPLIAGIPPEVMPFHRQRLAPPDVKSSVLSKTATCSPPVPITGLPMGNQSLRFPETNTR